MVFLFLSSVIQPLQISGTHFLPHRLQIPILPYYLRCLHWLSLQIRSGLMKLNICISSSQQINLLAQSQLGSGWCLPSPPFWFMVSRSASIFVYLSLAHQPLMCRNTRPGRDLLSQIDTRIGLALCRHPWGSFIREPLSGSKFEAFRVLVDSPCYLFSKLKYVFHLQKCQFFFENILLTLCTVPNLKAQGIWRIISKVTVLCFPGEMLLRCWFCCLGWQTGMCLVSQWEY